MRATSIRRPKFSDKSTLMRGTKEIGTYKHRLPLIVGLMLGADHIIMKTKVKNHTVPETLLRNQTELSKIETDLFRMHSISCMFRVILICKNKSKSKN